MPIPVKIDKNLSELNALVITHSFATGPAQELCSFLRPRVKTLAFIDHPFSFSKVKHSSLTVYRDGQQDRVTNAPDMTAPQLLLYMKDMFFTAFFAARSGLDHDVCVAADNLNAFSGIMLRALGRVRTVVFLTVDYTPKRFGNPLLNRIYHWLDSYCCRHCDYVWNSSAAMAEERAKKGVTPRNSAPQMVVPDGTYFDDIPRLTYQDINRYDIVFMGHLMENKGVEMIIDAFPEIRARVPAARLVIAGTGPLEKSLKTSVKANGEDNYVNFTGFVDEYKDLLELLAHCAVGIAPYVPDPDSFSFFSDTNKPKTYMACGLPVVITRVPRLAEEIEQHQAGIAIEYDKEQLIEAVVRLLSDDDLYRQYRENAISFAATFAWERIFTEALEGIGVSGLEKQAAAA